MPYRLVVSEKPSVAMAYAKVLGVTNRKDGYLEGGGYLVSWCIGHLVELAPPNIYDEKYVKWSIADLPILPQQWQYLVSASTKKQFGVLKDLMNRPDVDSIVCATDAGREGELIFRLVYQQTGCKKPFSRLWLSSMEDSAIREGFANLKPSTEYDALYQAALCRERADWMVGINASRLFSCLYGQPLAVGRVMTPVLAMTVVREAAIAAFVPEKFYTVDLELTSGCTASSRRIPEKSVAENLLKACRKEMVATIQRITRKEKSENPPPLYDLTTLQREANQKYGFSAKETLNIMQRLYENHKVLTYPRTDSRYIGKDVVPTIKERLQACGTGPYRKLAGALVNKPIQTSAGFVDDKKVSDHHAIIPTEQFVQLDHMTNEERKIYDMVVRRFLSVLYPPAVYELVSMEGTAAGETFAASGRIVKSAGWREVYEGGWQDEEEEDSSDKLKDQQLPELTEGQKLTVESASLTNGKTKPPARFTEATLLGAMENPVHFMESHDKKAAKTLGETGGLGTVATRADIIEKLFNSFMMEKRGNEIYITSKAKQLLELVPEELKKPELTADWEMKLSDIANGKLRQDKFLTGIRKYACEIVDEIKGGQGTFRHDNMTNKKCPNCGKHLLAVNGKNAKMLVCEDRECGYRETVSRTTNARCPKCHKRMEMLLKGKEETFVCQCGYKEKLSSFQARRAKEGAGVNKRDVQRYLKKQQKEANEPVNNAFAQALSGIKLD